MCDDGVVAVDEQKHEHLRASYQFSLHDYVDIQYTSLCDFTIELFVHPTQANSVHTEGPEINCFTVVKLHISYCNKSRWQW